MNEKGWCRVTPSELSWYTRKKAAVFCALERYHMASLVPIPFLLCAMVSVR